MLENYSLSRTVGLGGYFRPPSSYGGAARRNRQGFKTTKCKIGTLAKYHCDLLQYINLICMQNMVELMHIARYIFYNILLKMQMQRYLTETVNGVRERRPNCDCVTVYIRASE